MPLGQRMVHLLTTCINGDGKMDEAARRHRATACSHVILELSKAVSSLSVKGLTLDIPHALGHKLQLLSRDHDPKIAFAALKTIAVLERALLEQLSNIEDPNKSAELVKVLEAAIGENDSASPRYQSGLRYERRDGRLIAVTEFTSNILKLLKDSWYPSRQDIEGLQSVFEELCRGMNGRDYSPATQERFVNVVGETWDAHANSAPTDISSETHHHTIITSLKTLLRTLDDRFIESLKQRGLPHSSIGA